MFGVREISTVYLLGFFNIEKELALASALIYLFINYLVIITFYASLNINRINFFKKKNKDEKNDFLLSLSVLFKMIKNIFMALL